MSTGTRSKGKGKTGDSITPSPKPIKAKSLNAGNRTLNFNSPIFTPMVETESPKTFLGKIDSRNTLPISQIEIREWHEKLLMHDRKLLKFISESKESVTNKTFLQDLFINYQTAFNSIVAAYARVSEQMIAKEDCQSAVVKACTGLTSACSITVKEMMEKSIPSIMEREFSDSAENSHPNFIEKTIKKSIEKFLSKTLPNCPAPSVTYADVTKKSNIVKVGKDSSVQIPPTTSFTVAPLPGFAEKYATFAQTKDALIKTIDPIKVNLRVEKLTKSEGNAVRIEAKSVNLEAMRQLLNEANIGLHIKNSSKFNPRILLFGVPVDLSKEQILKEFIKSNLNGTPYDDVKVIYTYPPLNGKTTTKVVLEIPSIIRTALTRQGRIYLGFTSHKFIDHVKVKHCFKCLEFGHIAQECKSKDAHCGLCAGDHEMRNCPNTGGNRCCFSCKTKGLVGVSHAAVDGSEYQILINRLKAKVFNTDYGE